MRPTAESLRRALTHRRTRSSALTVGGVLGGAALAFAATIIAARNLSEASLAAFGVGLAVNSLAVQLSDFGLNTLTVTETAGDWARSGAGATGAKLRRIALRRILAAVLVAAILVAATFAIPDLRPYRAAALTGGLGAVLGTASVFAIASLQGAHRFRAASAVLLAVGGLRLVGVGAAALFGAGAVPMLVAYAVLAPFLAGGLGLWFLRGHGIGRRAEPGDEGAGAILDQGMQRTTAITATTAAGLLNLDVLLLALIAGQGEVAIYVAAWRIASGVLLLDTAVAQSLLPYIFVARDIWQETLRLTRLGLSLAAGLLVLVPAMTVAGLFLLGNAGDGAQWPLVLLLVAFSIDAFAFATYQVYLRIRRFRLLIVCNSLQLLTMLGVTVALREHGALAPAIGQLSARILGVAILGAPIAAAALDRRRRFRLPPAGETGHEADGLG